MDRIIISNDGYPLTNEWLTVLENLSVEQIQGLVQAVGNNVIVSGMAISGSNLTDGFLIYNNELLPFEASAIGTTIVIIEETTNAGYDTAGTGDFSTILPVWKTRKAKFGDPGDPGVVASFAFSVLSRQYTIKQLQEKKLEAAIEGGFNIFFNDTVISATAVGDFTGVTATPSLGYNSWSFTIDLTFPEVIGDYLPIFNMATDASSIHALINVYVKNKTSTSMQLIVFFRQDEVFPTHNYLTQFLISLIKV